MSNARKLADNLPGIGATGSRNIIINGAMNISQRQTSSSNVGNKYVLDRFYVYRQNAGSTYTCSQNSVTDLQGFSNSLKMLCSTADTSLASNEQVYIQYKVEGQDCQRLAKGHGSDALPMTLSFYVKTNKSGLYTVRIYDRDNGRNVSGSYTVSNANWNRYSVTFPADASGKLDDDNNSSLEFFWHLVGGSDITSGSLQTTWAASSDAGAATGQVNLGDAINNAWEITGIQLETGSRATAFEHEPISASLAKCQRYFHKELYPTGPGPFSMNYVDSHRFFHLYHPTTMRTTPTSTVTYGGGVTATEYHSTENHWKAYLAASYNSTSQHYLTTYQADAEL
tara:strand:- start:411 stop:1427 length:1017 start_codon:yes stop_codon:yes gene_type:complete